MELVAGLPFFGTCGADKNAISRLRDALRDLARVLGWLHGHRLIHRDIAG